MKKCNNCGAELSDDALYCHECGSEQNPAEQQSNGESAGESENETSKVQAEEKDDVHEGEAFNGNDSVEAEVIPPVNNFATPDSIKKPEYAYYGSQGQSGYGASAGGYMQQGQPVYTGKVALNTDGINPRNIAMAIILSFLTCGIYMYYWIYSLNEEVNQLSDDKDALSGGMVLLLIFVTCGFYVIYWYYKMGTKIDRFKGDKDGGTGTLYLVLGLLGLGIVDIGLIQNEVNKAVYGEI